MNLLQGSFRLKSVLLRTDPREIKKNACNLVLFLLWQKKKTIFFFPFFRETKEREAVRLRGLIRGGNRQGEEE